LAGKKSKDQTDYYTRENVREMMEKLPDPIFVTDASGNVLLTNSAAAYSMDIAPGKMLQSNVMDLVDKGYYSMTNVTETVKHKKTISGTIKTKIGVEYISTSTPVFDKEGNVTLVITYGRPLEQSGKKNVKEQSEQEERRKREIDYLRSYVFDQDMVIAESRNMQKVLLTAHAVAQTDSTVVLYGETGTGKDILAKYIHKNSKRAKEAFIATNCATLNESLVESELFGYEKGAFTGALSEGKIGLFAAANRGTLFLDEIAELPLPLQAKLLRVLETGAIRRIGSNVEEKSNFRLIAATHRDLKKMVDEGTFRYDLYYRLNVVPINIPPLRDRHEDILALSSMFVEEYNKKYSADFVLDPEILKSFQEYNWPGNVRELRNVIERNVIINLHKYDEDNLSVMPHLPSNDHGDINIFKALGLGGSLKEVMKKVEEQYIRLALKETGGKVGKAAEKLGIYRTVLYRKLKEYEEKNEEKNKEA